MEGHTDQKGTAAYNVNLSGRRAASVVNWLVKHGAAKGRLYSKGYGRSRPIDTNDTEEGRQNNRLVELHIEEKGAKPGDKPGENKRPGSEVHACRRQAETVGAGRLYGCAPSSTDELGGARRGRDSPAPFCSCGRGAGRTLVHSGTLTALVSIASACRRELPTCRRSSRAGSTMFATQRYAFRVGGSPTLREVVTSFALVQGGLARAYGGTFHFPSSAARYSGGRRVRSRAARHEQRRLAVLQLPALACGVRAPASARSRPSSNVAGPAFRMRELVAPVHHTKG